MIFARYVEQLNIHVIYKNQLQVSSLYRNTRIEIVRCHVAIKMILPIYIPWKKIAAVCISIKSLSWKHFLKLIAYSESPWSFLSSSIYAFSFTLMYYQKSLSTMRAPSCPDSCRFLPYVFDTGIEKFWFNIGSGKVCCNRQWTNDVMHFQCSL
jgi:hypothetical protein